VFDTVAETVTFGLLNEDNVVGVSFTSTTVVTFLAGPVTRHEITAVNSGTVDNVFVANVTSRDVFGNINASAHSLVVLSTLASLQGVGAITLRNGTSTLSMTSRLPGSVVLTLQPTHPDIDQTVSVSFSIGIGAPVAVTAVPPPPAVVGVAHTIDFQLQDQFGNVVPRNLAVTLLVSGQAVTGNGTVQLVDGRGLRSIQSNIAQNLSLALADTFNSGFQMRAVPFQLVPDVAASILILDPADATAGDLVPVTVQARDRFNNLANRDNSSFVLLIDAAPITLSFSGGLVTYIFNVTRVKKIPLPPRKNIKARGK
jgi:hypothetical protein